MSELTQRFRDRLRRAQEETAARGLEALWIEPSVGLSYLTGLDLVSIERVTALIIPAEGDLRMVVPLLLRDECGYLGASMEVWDDNEGPDAAVQRALKDISSLHVQGSLPAAHLFALKHAVPGLEAAEDPGIIRDLRERKDSEEVAAIKRSGEVTDGLVEWIGGLDLASLTERQVALNIEARFLMLGYKPSPYGLVASGANAAMPHYVGGDTPISMEHLLLLDFGCAVDGYWSDITRIYFPEDLDSQIEEAYGIVCDAYEAAFAILEPGVPCNEIDRAARAVIAKAGYGENFLHRTGHGLGLEVHEPPYLTGMNDRPLEVGHVFSIEPGIYVAGRFGVRYENIVHLAPDGPESMNKSPRRHLLKS
jgi:Xaa-Pro aminopeptidase